jgi:MEKHLA domain
VNLVDHISLLFKSYSRLTGRTLGENSWTGLTRENLVNSFRSAPFVIASHGTETDPILNYGNNAALLLWEATWEEFTTMPSRLTAEPMERTEREHLLHEVTTKGFIDNYSGVRISTKGRRFRIHRATVWNVLDDANIYCGQAVVFSDWDFLV